MSTLFFASDLHLGHAGFLKWKDNPRKELWSSVEEHDEAIINNWNSAVGKRDVIWVLGDVAFNHVGLKSLSRLKGIKHLVIGNHDRYLRTHHVKFFNTITGCVSFKKDFLLTHIPAHPMSVRPRYQFNIHGHIHNNPTYSEEYYNISLEAINYTPKPWEEIKDELNYDS